MSWNTYYPRPQLRRNSFFAPVDGWKLNGTPICMPFPPQSELSAYKKSVDSTLCYEVSFALPDDFLRARTFLHFGACDQTCRVFLNGTEVGSHEGGYHPFSFDITDTLQADNLLVVEAKDVGGTYYPYGKQCDRPHGMWYTPVSGIWQSVWLESVPETYIRSVKITTTLQTVRFEVDTNAPTWTAEISLPGGATCTITDDTPFALPAESIRLWSPQSPYLYNVVFTAGDDRVESYFAMRTVSIRHIGGKNRLCLNETPIFLNGVLDQGYFADGIFLPATPDAYEADILRMKALGFNCLRKHIKVEPACFYHACDKLGMLVWQDFVNNGAYHFFTQTVLPTFGFSKKSDRKKPSATERFFRAHARETQALLYNHPSVIGYTIFNEGWGQRNADDAYTELQAADPTRLYDATSGWFAQSKSDFESKHIYFRNKVLTATGTRPIFLSECGGYTRNIAGHTDKKRTYGYGKTETEAELTERICDTFRKMVIPSIPHGLCGSIYTQLSDVEGERNGLYTYDRQICKVDVAAIASVAEETFRAFEADVRGE